MKYLKISTLLLVLLFLLKSTCFGQLPYNLIDGRTGNYCAACEKTIESMPREVLFGIQVNTDGSVYFSMNNTEWFNKIFPGNSYGVSVDLVSKDRYNCKSNHANDDNEVLPRGAMLFPVFKPDLVKGIDGMTKGQIFVKIGKVPAALLNRELEGNLVIVNGNNICYYTNFVNIDRNVWQLLPMGLFTDSLLQDTKTNTSGQTDFFTYTKRIQIEIPFAKSSASFGSSYLPALFDSLDLGKYSIRKIEVRAYSSIEGPEKINNELMSRRADSILNGLKKYQAILQRVNIIKAENWLDFFRDIENTKFSGLQELSKPEIKQKLTDSSLKQEIEPLLAKQRKAIVTMYLESKSGATEVPGTSILSDFNKAVNERKITVARTILKEIAERIASSKLPYGYIKQIEVPQTKEFSSLLSDREVYKYLLKATTEYEALENFLALKSLDPYNGRICYNVCALRFFMWQYGGDTISQNKLLPEINMLPSMGINNVLVKRMLINYHILKCEENLRVFNYTAKDRSLLIIRDIYKDLVLNDEDIFSIAKYYAYYSHQQWAEEIITPRIDKTDVSEDLVFYYTNLLFFNPGTYASELFHKACLNAINLNRKRFCKFFLPNDKGGASMQLLEYEEIKAMYCDGCK